MEKALSLFAVAKEGEDEIFSATCLDVPLLAVGFHIAAVGGLERHV